MSIQGLDFLKGCLKILSENLERILAFQKYLETDFEKKLFEAAINNLLDIHNPLRFNNFSYAMRELLDHILKRLARDECVKKCIWYTPPDSEREVVRSQRIKYAIQKGLSDNFILEELGIDVSTVQRNVKHIIRELNKYVHINQDTFDVDPIDQLEKLSSFLESILKMFEIIDSIKTKIINSIIGHIEGEVVDEILKNYSELEEYATHAYWGDYEIETVELEDIDYEKLQIRVSGIIKPEFQIGSDSDVKKGNGMVFTKQIPFVAHLISNIKNPYELQVEKFNMDIDDTRDFWEDIRILKD